MKSEFAVHEIKCPKCAHTVSKENDGDICPHCKNSVKLVFKELERAKYLQNKFSSSKYNPYEVDKLAQIPSWLKIGFLNWWFAGMIIFFFGMANPISVLNGYDYDIIAFLTIISSVIYFTVFNTIVRLMNNDVEPTEKFILVQSKHKNPLSNGKYSILGGLCYLLLTAIVVSGVVYTYKGINLAINNFNNVDEFNINIGVESFLYATVYIIYYYLVLMIVNFVKKLILKKEVL